MRIFIFLELSSDACLTNVVSEEGWGGLGCGIIEWVHSEMFRRSQLQLHYAKMLQGTRAPVTEESAAFKLARREEAAEALLAAQSATQSAKTGEVHPRCN